MGIGAAFATGLLKGFSDNMDKEGLRRQAMRDRFDGYETMAVDAVLKGDATTGGLNAIRNLVQKANTEIDSMEPIGPFGARGRDVTMDMAKVQSALGKAKEFGVSYGRGSNQIGFSPILSKGIDAKVGRSYLSEVAAFYNFGDEDALKKLDALDSAEAIRLWNDTNAARAAIHKAEKSVDKELYKMPDHYKAYKGLEGLDNYWKTRFKNKRPIGVGDEVALSTWSVEVASIMEQEKTQHGTVPDTVIIEQKGDKIGYKPIYFDTDADREALASMAKNLSKATGVDIKPHQVGAYWQTNFMKIAGITYEDQANSFKASLMLQKEIRFMDKLDPDENVKMLPQEILDKVYSVAKKTGAPTVQLLGYALAPSMSGPDKMANRPLGQFESAEIPVESVQKYILTRMYGEEKAKTASWADVANTQFALKNTTNRINDLKTELLNLKATNDVPLAYDAWKGQLIAIFDPSQGFFGGLIDDITGAGSSIVDDNTLNVNDPKNLTTAYEKLLRDRVSRAGGEKAAKLEAMKISLAYEMARAADPSGRLSNQDIEQQYRKLGSKWSTVGQALSALEVTTKEFAVKEAQYDLFSKIGDSQRIATEADYRVIDGMITADYVIRSQEQTFSNSQPKIDTLAGTKERFGITFKRLRSGRIVDLLNSGVKLEDTEEGRAAIQAFEEWEKQQPAPDATDASLQTSPTLPAGTSA